MEFRYQAGEAVRTVRVEREGEVFRVSVDGGEEREVRVVSAEGTALELDLFGARQRVHVVREGTRRLVALGADCFDFAAAGRGAAAGRAGVAHGTDDLTAPMPGQVIAVSVSAGEVVTRGQTLVVLEAMKMELRITAPHDGTLGRVLVIVGQVVERGQLLVEIAA